MMKLELIDRDNERPLLRLFAFSPADVALLREVFVSLASGSTPSVEVHSLSFIEPVSDCRLTLIASSLDQGVVKLTGTALKCSLSAGTWANIAGLIEPFAEAEPQYQWLDSTNIPILLSRDGSW
jgi:hypothetical protein